MTATTWEFAAKQAAQQILTSYEKQRDVFVAARAQSGDHLAWIEHDIDQLKEGLFSENAVPIESRGSFVSIGVAVLAHIESGFVGGQRVNAQAALRFYVDDICDVLAKKQHDYGHENIAAFGARGITVRLSDKLARLRNLERRANESANESIEDTWLDLFGYAVIGVMWEDETFGLALAADVPQVTCYDEQAEAAAWEAEAQTEHEQQVSDNLAPFPYQIDPETAALFAEERDIERKASMARHPSAQCDAASEPGSAYTIDDEHFVLRAIQAYCDGQEFEHAVRELVRDELGHAAEARRNAIRNGHGASYAPPVPTSEKWGSAPDVAGEDVDPRTRYKATS